MYEITVTDFTYFNPGSHLAESKCTVMTHGDDATGVFCVYRCSEEGTSAHSESGSLRTTTGRNQVRFHRREANLFTYHSYSTSDTHRKINALKRRLLLKFASSVPAFGC